MKKIDYLAVEYSKKYTKDWDYFILSSQGYRAGYEQAKKDVSFQLSLSSVSPHWYDIAKEVGNQEIEVPEGEHQLSAASFETWRKQNESMSLKDALETYLPWFNFTDLRVHEKDGIISFMGVCKRNENN